MTSDHFNHRRPGSQIRTEEHDPGSPETIGKNAPVICYHEATTPEGICRQCVVEVEGWRVLAPACVTKVSDGMVIHTESERVHSLQAHDPGDAECQRRPLPGARTSGSDGRLSGRPGTLPRGQDPTAADQRRQPLLYPRLCQMYPVLALHPGLRR